MGGSSSKAFSYDAQLLGDTEIQSAVVPESQIKGHSSIYVHPSHKDGYTLPSNDEGVQLDTIWKMYSSSAKKHSDLPCLGFRPWTGDGDARGDYKYLTYGEVDVTVGHISSALNSLGLKFQESVGLYSKNRPEWLQVHLANQKMGYKTTALYSTLGDDAVKYIIDHGEVKVAFVEKSAVKPMLSAISQLVAEDNLKFLTHVVVFDHQEVFGNAPETIDEDHRTEAEKLGVKFFGLSELIKMGQDAGECKQADVDKEDVAFLMYTSGTTGNPKGVLLKNVGFCQAVLGAADEMFKMVPSDRHMSFLPLAHIFEILIETGFVACGGSISYYQGSVKKLTEDWLAVKPTIVAGVPRVFATIYGKLMAGIGDMNCIKKYVINKAFADSTALAREGKRNEKNDKKIFSQIAAKVGLQECRLIISGAAPLPPYLADFLRVLLCGGHMVQGYGMTETTAASVVQILTDVNLGNVGIPCPGVQLRLQDIPEMEYMNTDKHPRGEILLKGPTIMGGYFKNKEKTDEVMEDGWMHTGDVGRINPNGTLSIIDRKKNLFKTAYGEYIPVNKVEDSYGKAASSNQCFVYGNSYKNFIVAIVVPAGQWAQNFLKSKGKWKDEGLMLATPEWCAKFKTVCEDNRDLLTAAVLADMRAMEGGLKKFEKIKAISLEFEVDVLLQGFNVENNCLTPSFKLKRPILKKRYIDVLKQMYTDNGEPPKPDEKW